MGIIERLNRLIAWSGLSVSAFAKKVGCTQSSLDRYCKGTTKMPYELIEKISEIYPDISAEWLLRGEGMMEKVYTFLDDREEFQYTPSGRRASAATPNEFEQGLEELRRRVSDLERQSSSTAEAV